MNDDRAVNLRQQIITAFQDARRPGNRITDHFDDPNPRKNLDLSTAVKYFKNRTWKECDGKSLFLESDARVWFTDEALCYWLPAYLIEALDESKEIDTAIDFVVWEIAGLHRPARSLSSLTPDQFDAVESFLEYCLEESGSCDRDEYQGALDEVRRQRVETLKR